jgi:hypothetical protein
MTENSESSSKVIDLFAEGRGLLVTALQSATYLPPKQATSETDLAAAILLHAMSVRENADAMLTLSRAGHGGSLVVHSRTVFETNVKMVWLTREPARATRFFQSEPFERYWLAAKHTGIMQRPVWKRLLADCKATVEANPKLLQYPKDGVTGNRPDYLEIAKALRIPDVEGLIDAAGWSSDAYVEDFLIPSLSSHVSVIRLREIPKGVHADGSMLLN